MLKKCGYQAWLLSCNKDGECFLAPVQTFATISLRSYGGIEHSLTTLETTSALSRGPMRLSGMKYLDWKVL